MIVCVAFNPFEGDVEFLEQPVELLPEIGVLLFFLFLVQGLKNEFGIGVEMVFFVGESVIVLV